MLVLLLEVLARNNRETITLEKKHELLMSVMNQSSRQVEQSLASLYPEEVKNLNQDKQRVLNEEYTEVKFVASKALLEKLEKIKNITAHKNPNPTMAELIDLLAEYALDKIDPMRKERKAKKSENIQSATLTSQTTTPTPAGITHQNLQKIRNEVGYLQ